MKFHVIITSTLFSVLKGLDSYSSKVGMPKLIKVLDFHYTLVVLYISRYFRQGERENQERSYFLQTIELLIITFRCKYICPPLFISDALSY